MNLDLPFNKQLMSFDCDGETVTVVYRIPSKMYYTGGGQMPDDVVKQVYKVVDGSIQMVDWIKGKIVPQRIIPESIDWQNDK